MILLEVLQTKISSRPFLPTHSTSHSGRAKTSPNSLKNYNVLKPPL